MTCGTAATGLTTREATDRLARYGPNTLGPRHRRRLLVEFLLRFRNPLVLLLLAVSAVSAAMGDVASFGIVTAMVLMSVTLDFVQEHRAGRAAERLQVSVAVRSLVVRDGRPCDLPASALVPGDVIRLTAGDLVPADGRVVGACDLFVNQAVLTGEPYPMERRTGATVAMGTSVVSGSATVLIEQTGARTTLGTISSSVSVEPPPTAFDRGTRAFGFLIVRLTLLLTLAVVLINLILDRPRLESFFFAVALAVGLTPELLPMIVSVCLARGALRMADRKVIVKRLAAIHDLGAMDVLCVDKTGTLTEACIRLEHSATERTDLAGVATAPPLGAPPPSSSR
jgi:P-type Mg2+ transporter